MTDYTIINNQLNASDFIRLFASAGWGELPLDLVEATLKGSWATFSVCHEGQTIAMARLLGDGAMSFFHLPSMTSLSEHECGNWKLQTLNH